MTMEENGGSTQASATTGLLPATAVEFVQTAGATTWATAGGYTDPDIADAVMLMVGYG